MTRAIRILEKKGVPFAVHRYRHDPRAGHYGMEAAEALGISPHRIFKTLVILLDGRKEAVALVPASKHLDLKAVASVFEAKSAEMAPPETAEKTTGCVVGGISPLGHRKPLPVALDETVRHLETVYVSAGKRGLQVELRPDDLIGLCNGSLGKISR